MRTSVDPSDLAFVLDCTGSMQRYINSVRDHIFAICDMIRGEEGLNGEEDLRVAVSGEREWKGVPADDRLSTTATISLKITRTCTSSMPLRPTLPRYRST